MKKTLVFGASLKPNRYSNLAIHRLLAHDIKTEAFGLKEGEISEVQIKTNFNNFQNIHTITLYINPQLQAAYYTVIIGLRPKRVIFNPGTENPEFIELLKQNKIETEVACTLVLLSTHQY